MDMLKEGNKPNEIIGFAWLSLFRFFALVWKLPVNETASWLLATQTALGLLLF